jgi:phosphatidylserine/phosphatidylglycerophosphate/cardiolipin synthase-like enzyme
MMQAPAFPGISSQVLGELSAALRSGRLAWPASATSLRARGHSTSEGLMEGLRALHEKMPAAESAALVLSMLAAERSAAEEEARRRVELVWSGPEGKAQSRDTAITVSQLFAEARRKVLVSTYNVGWTAGLFAPLVEKMQNDPAFEVKLFVNISAKLMEKKMQRGEDPVAAFRRAFVETHWRTARLPAVYYDPRAAKGTSYAPQLHAKCVVVDEEAALLTSANFSEAAQNDNIEAGVLVRDARFAEALVQQFEGLLARNELVRVI